MLNLSKFYILTILFMKKLKNYFKAFTLVELIIVITILAILATISFISFQNFTKDARDGNRISTLTSIEKWLNLIQLKTWKYPNPDWDVLTGALNLWWSELVYSSMWIIDENISRMINISKTPLDPVSNSNYVYAVNNKQDTYQIATLLESLEANRKLPLIKQTYANTNYTAKVVWNHEINVKVSTWSYTYLTTIPSMIFNPEWWNILNTWSTHHIINGWQNLPYKTNDKIITSKEIWDKIIQHIRKSQDAKIITVDITDIVKASNETTRKAKIEEIFWTWNTQESKELLASIWAITWSEETINTTILTQTVESIITGWSVSTASSYTAPKTPATCWTANKTYENTANSFWTDTFCDVWTLDWENPTFPSQWNSVNWTCISPDGWVNASCSATKLNPNEEVKECSWKPANSKYYNWSDTHLVTVNFWSSAPTPNYAETPSENSCDFSCNAWFTNVSWSCNDTTAPTWWSFTINNNAASTNTTAVTLNITCPTDAAWSTPIQVAYWNTTNPTNWTTCTSSISHTLTTWDWTKTVYMRFRDSVGNTTINDVTDEIMKVSYLNYGNSTKTAQDCTSNGWVLVTISWDSNWTQLCKFSQGSCKSGWTPTNWKTWWNGTCSVISVWVSSCTDNNHVSICWWLDNSTNACHMKPTTICNSWTQSWSKTSTGPQNNCTWATYELRLDTSRNQAGSTLVWSCTWSYPGQNRYKKTVTSTCTAYSVVTEIWCY